MSVSHPDDEAELYCQPADVARFVRPRDHNNPNSPPPQNFLETTRPSTAEVLKHIEGASTRFDRKTQQSFRASTVTDETHDHQGIYYWLSGHPIRLQKKNIRPLDPEKGDKLEVWTGNVWEDWLEGTYEQGRENDFWIDGPLGILWVYERAILRPHPKFRVTYRYGYEHIPADIREAVAKRAAADIVTGDFGGSIVPGNNQGDNADPGRMAEIWRDDFKEVCRDYKKLGYI